MSKFEEMSELEINKLVAEAQGFRIEKRESSILYLQRKGGTTKYLRDYCNSWADMGPILELIWDNLFEPIECEQGCNMTAWEYYRIKTGSTTKAAAIIYLESLETSNE